MFEQYFTHDLKENEEIVRVIRKHWITFSYPALKIFGVLIIPFIFTKFFLSSLYGAIFYAIWLLAGFLYGTYLFLDWYLDSFIITNLRIIDIDQDGLFKRTVSETEFSKIQDVSYSVTGFIATIFKFGTCRVQTAASEHKIGMENISNPQEVQELLVKLQRKQKNETQSPVPELSAQELIELIQKGKNVKKGEKEQGTPHPIKNTAPEIPEEQGRIIDLSQYRKKDKE